MHDEVRSRNRQFSSNEWAGKRIVIRKDEKAGQRLIHAKKGKEMKRGTMRQSTTQPGGGAPTKKVTIFVGSAHKGGATYRAASRFLQNLESFGDVHGEIVDLSDYIIGVCRGCKTCFDRGEERCPLKDDRDLLIEKMTASDGVVFSSPNYTWQVSAVMKIFLDRLAFLCHRPRFHGKISTCIVVQGIFRGDKIVDYLEFVGGSLGFDVVKGSCIRTLEPMDEKALAKMERILSKQSRRFHARLLQASYPVPSLFGLMMFRMVRTSIKLMLGDDKRDFMYYRDQGWFESDYYYPTHLSPLKKAAGVFFDWIAPRIFGQRELLPGGAVWVA
jgi:multimeric flavodoxin WrbA